MPVTGPGSTQPAKPDLVFTRGALETLVKLVEAHILRELEGGGSGGAGE